jgi:hypothetical protein
LLIPQRKENVMLNEKKSTSKNQPSLYFFEMEQVSLDGLTEDSFHRLLCQLHKDDSPSISLRHILRGYRITQPLRAMAEGQARLGKLPDSFFQEKDEREQFVQLVTCFPHVWSNVRKKEELPFGPSTKLLAFGPGSKAIPFICLSLETHGQLDFVSSSASMPTLFLGVKRRVQQGKLFPLCLEFRGGSDADPTCAIYMRTTTHQGRGVYDIAMGKTQLNTVFGAFAGCFLMLITQNGIVVHSWLAFPANLEMTPYPLICHKKM